MKPKVKLTDGEMKAWHTLNRAPVGFLRKHKRPTGAFCFRLLDEKVNPIANLDKEVIAGLVEKGALVLDGEQFTLKKI